MINKKSIWFVTLFTLILVLSVYYVTMPSELLLSNSSNYTKEKAKNKEQKEDKKEVSVKVEESEILTSLRVESNEKVQEQLDKLKTILTNADATVEDKNVAYEQIQSLNITRGEEEKIEKKLLDEFKLKTFVKVEGDQVRVVALSKSHDIKLANQIMRSVQKNFTKKMYISVQFENS